MSCFSYTFPAPVPTIMHRYIYMMVKTGARKVDEKQDLKSKQFEIDCLTQSRRATVASTGNGSTSAQRASYIFAAETADTTVRELGSSSIVLDFEQLKH